MQGVFHSPKLGISSKENNTMLITVDCSEASLITSQGCVNPIEVCVFKNNNKNTNTN